LNAAARSGAAAAWPPGSGLARLARSIVAGGAIGLCLAGCHPAGSARARTVAAQSVEVRTAPVQAALAVRAVVTLSPVAAAALADRGETIAVSAVFQGRFGPAREETVVLPGAGTATLRVPQMEPSRLEAVTARPADVAIQVFSGERATGGNLLDCGGSTVQPLKLAMAGPIQIHCKLRGDNPSTSTAIAIAALLGYFDSANGLLSARRGYRPGLSER
jgi:hypothetical protein